MWVYGCNCGEWRVWVLDLREVLKTEENLGLSLGFESFFICLFPRKVYLEDEKVQIKDQIAEIIT